MKNIIVLPPSEDDRKNHVMNLHHTLQEYKEPPFYQGGVDYYQMTAWDVWERFYQILETSAEYEHPEKIELHLNVMDCDGHRYIRRQQLFGLCSLMMFLRPYMYDESYSLVYNTIRQHAPPNLNTRSYEHGMYHWPLGREGLNDRLAFCRSRASEILKRYSVDGRLLRVTVSDPLSVLDFWRTCEVIFSQVVQITAEYDDAIASSFSILLTYRQQTFSGQFMGLCDLLRLFKSVQLLEERNTSDEIYSRIKNHGYAISKNPTIGYFWPATCEGHANRLKFIRDEIRILTPGQ